MSETGVRQRTEVSMATVSMAAPTAGSVFSVSGFTGFALEVHKTVSPKRTLQELVKRPLNWPIPASEDIQWL